jgi:drug/metabolite transporter (DMT)-like permease
MTVAATAETRKTRTAWYFFLLALACLIWSAQGAAVKFLGRQLGPVAITFLPFYITTALMAPLLWRTRRGSNPGRNDWVKFAVAGVGGQVLAQLGMTWGITKSLASNAAILNLMIPVITAVLASFLLRERITSLRVAALAIGLLGVLLLSAEDLRQSSFGQMKYLAGNVLILGGCLGSSFYNVYCKGLLARYQEIEILIYSYITASAASVPLLIWVEPFRWESLRAFDWKSWTAFAFLAVLMYGASMLLFFAALKHLDVTAASMSLYLVPVFGVILAAVLLGERLSLLALCGAAAVLAATVLIIRYDNSD